MLNKSIREDYLFELCRTCNDLEKFRNAIQKFEKQNAGSRLDENNNLILNNYSPPQNAICNLRDADGRTLLHHCVANYTDRQECCQYLIQHYPQLVLTPDYQGYTIIHLAVLDGNVKLLKFICAKGRHLIDEPVFKLLLQSADNELHSAIHWAVICQEYACLVILIETTEQLRSTDSNDHKSSKSELSVNMRDIHGATCLHYASMLSAKSKFFDLLSEESKINRLEREMSNQNRKRLDSGVVEANSLSSQNQKIEYEQTERAKSAEKKTALKILNKILHSKNVHVNCQDNDRRTPLMWSSRLGESKAIKELLAAGADVNAQDNEGRTAMHCAATKGDKACIETLFKHGNANINAEDKNGSIALHYAAKFGSVDACRSLLNLGSFVDSINYRGQSVIHCAASKGNYWICRALVEEFDADLWKRDAKGELALHYAVRSGNKELVKWILSLNPSAVNVGNNFGRTCLHLASQTNNIQLCKLLIDCGASVNALMKQRNFNEHLYHQMDEVTRKTYLRTSRREKFGISMVTPLDLALQRNFRNCAHFLVLSGAFPAAKLGLNNIMSKSNPNLYLEPEEGSKDSNDSTFESELIQNELNSTYNANHKVQSPYSNIIGSEDQPFNIYSKQIEPQMDEKLRRPTIFNQVPVHSNQYSANLPNINSNNLIDDLLTGDQQKRSYSQPVFTTTERRSTSHNFVQSDNGLDINQYALVQNSSGSSIVDYSVDDLTKTQSIVTNVYLNCSHHGRHVMNPVRKRKMKLIKMYSSQRNLNYDLNDLEENTRTMNQFNSLSNLVKSDESKAANLFANDMNRQKKDESLIAELDANEKADDDDVSNTSGSLTELKNMKTGSEQVKLERPTKLNQLKEETRKALNDSKDKLDASKMGEEKRSPNEDCSNKSDSRCSHHLHHKPEIYATKYSTDFSHIKPKVNTRNNISLLKAQSNLLRSKSNLEDLALEELDEAGEIMQNAEKSLRKYQIERKLLQELQDLKRYQIRSNQVNEAAFVKRLAEQFRKQNKYPGMAEFFGPYTYKSYERYLYDQIRKLSSSNEGKIPLPLLNIINMNSISVYDQSKHASSRLMRSKKMSKSSEDNKIDQQNVRRELSKVKDTIKLAQKETIEMPIKVTSLNAIRKDQQIETLESDENGQRRMDLRMDYVQTDENETLQDISTSFSEEKFDSLPEQMTSEAIKKQFHEAFKSMSIVNEEASDQDSSVGEKTEVEKPPQKPIQEDGQLKEDKKITLTDASGTNVDKLSNSNEDKKASLKGDKKSSIKESKIVLHKTLDAEKQSAKISFHQVDQPAEDASKINQLDPKIESSIKTVKSRTATNFGHDGDEQIFDENNNEIFKDLDDMIMTNVTSVQTIFTTNYLKQEQSEMINKGWVVVDSIKEIDEKEDEIKKEEISATNLSHQIQQKPDSQKHSLRESAKKESTESFTKLIEKQDSDKVLNTQKLEVVMTERNSEEKLRKQNSIIEQSKDDLKAIIIEKGQIAQKSVEISSHLVDGNKTLDDNKTIESEQMQTEELIKKNEHKSLEKAKSESSSSSESKAKKTKISSSSSTSDSKIPKLSKSVKLSSSSLSTPSKSISSKSSSTSCSSGSSPIRKSTTLLVQSKVEEISDRMDATQSDVEKIKADKSNEVRAVKTELKVDFKADSFDKTIIFDEDKIVTSKVEETDKKIIEEIGAKDKTEQISQPSKMARKLSVVSFEPTLLQGKSSSVDEEKVDRKKYAKTPIKQLSIELIEKLNDEELNVPTDEKEDDSSPQSLTEENNKELMRKEKNDLIENMDKKLREETIKQKKEIEEIVLTKWIDEEQKIVKKQELKNEIVDQNRKIEQAKSRQVEKVEIIEEEKIGQGKKTEVPQIDSKTDLLKSQKSLSRESEQEEKADEKLAKAETKSEIIYKKSSIEKMEDISERTAYIENMLRTSGYTEKIIEKANEFINGKEGDKSEDGVVEEVTVKLVKKNSKDYHKNKEIPKQTLSEKKTAEDDKKETNVAKKTSDNTNNQQKTSQKSNSQQTSKRSFGQTRAAAASEKPVIKLKKSTSLSKIPTLQPSSKTTKQVEISTLQMQKQEDDHGKMTSIEQTSFRRNCLKPFQTKSEPIEQAINRPEFKRKKSNLPPKQSIQLNSEQIKKKWHDIKTNEKDKLQHQFNYSSHLRRTTSNPVLSNSFDLIYEVNKMPKWAQNASTSQQKKSSQHPRSNTSIITQTKRILEKIEKKEIEEVTTRTIINDEEKCTTRTTSREESKTQRSETEESLISGKQCAICKKIIIPLTEDMKFCKRDLRKMLSDSALEIKHCRC